MVGTVFALENKAVIGIINNYNTWGLCVTQTSIVTKRLQTLLTNGDEVDRCYAIQGLVTIRDVDSTKLITKCLRDDDIDVCVDAASALGELGGESVADTLIQSLINDPDGEVKVACVKALTNLGDYKATTHLLELAEHRPKEIDFSTEEWDPWWDMQLDAIKGLGKMQVTEAVPVLQRVLEAGECIDIENEILNSLAEISGVADDYLIQQLKQGIPRTRRRVTKALGQSKSDATLKPLARTLKDEDADTREEALRSLLKRNTVQYLPAILLLFRDTNTAVRQTAIMVAHQLSQQLQTNDNEEYTELAAGLSKKLIPLLQDPDPAIKATALKTLANLNWKPDSKNTEIIVAMLRDSRGDDFASVCQFVQAQQLEDAVPVLLYMFRNNELEAEEKVIALNTLGLFRLWNPVIESTIGACVFDKKKMVRLAALEALAELDKSLSVSLKNKDEDIRLPIHMITEALHGKLKPPATKRVIPIIAETSEKKPAEADEAADHHAADDKVSNDRTGSTDDDSFVENALEKISQSIDDGKNPHPLSTLDSMAIASVIADKEQQQEQQADDEEQQKLSTEDAEELKDFLDLTEKNTEITKWLFSREAADVNVDIQHLAARFLGCANSDNAIPALLDIFPCDDNTLKREAILSIGLLLKNENNLSAETSKAIHEILISELYASDRDLRIAAARTLGALGTSEDIAQLIPALQDSEVAMRIQTIHSLSEIAQRSTKGNVELKGLAGNILLQLNNNDTGVHRAAVDALVPLFRNKLNGDAVLLKETAISSLINAGLSGSDGQVREMSWGLNALDKELSSIRLLARLDELPTSVERRYVVEMLAELHRPN